MQQKNRLYILEGNRAQWCIFVVFFLLIFAKSMLFQWHCFGSYGDANNGHVIYNLCALVFPKMAVALFISSLVLVIKRAWWTILISIFIDVWIIANLMYYRNSGLLLDAFSFSMAGNMNGFLDSVLFYYSGKDMLYFGLTLLYALFLFFIPKFSKRRWGITAICVISSILLSIAGTYTIAQEKGVGFRRDFCNSLNIQTRLSLSSVSYADQIETFSILHSIGFIAYDWIMNMEADIKINKEQLSKQVEPFISDSKENVSFDTPLILILVESLEDWAVNETSTPNLCDFLKTHTCLHAHKLSKQTRGGESADGQMLLNTGLLPTASGAACFRFPTNIYPSIGKCCVGEAVTILPHKIGVWNQQYMSPAYGYDTTIIRSEDDKELFQSTIDCIQNGYQMVQIITMSSHTPFDYGAKYSTLQLPAGMPTYMADYLKSIHCMDAGLNVLLSSIDTDSLLLKSTIVITGDHTIFRSDMRDAYSNWCANNNQDYRVNEAFVPLIIYSPTINEAVEITDTCYQMDMYPTIMNLIGCQDYYWKGFGVNLLVTNAIYNRPITPNEAFRLSNDLIRSDWFSYNPKNHKKQEGVYYIAHAGGSIDGYTYTNSLEAVQNAIDNGVEYVELDLAFTADSQIVASHGWGKDWATIPTHEQYMSRKIHNKYTPLDIKRIDSIMRANPSLCLVTDKISDHQILDTYFSWYSNRVWVECFSDDDYFILERKGFHVMRSGMPPSTKSKWKRTISHLSLRDFKIKNYVIDFNNDMDLSKYAGECFAVYAGENISAHMADSIFMVDDRIKFIYVDFFSEK